MSEVSSFPSALLAQPIADRVAYFEHYITKHPRAKKLADELFDTIINPCGHSLIFVCGPPCVGKTTVFREVGRRILQHAASTPTRDPGHIPLVAFEIPFIKNSGRFESRDYFASALRALREPMIDKKLKDPPASLREITEIDHYAAKIHRPDQGLHWALIQALRHRRPAAIMLDEAHNFTRVGGSLRLDAQLCWLKSMANLSKVVHVLFGTYELHQFREQSWEISRRGMELHFSRYRGELKEDRKDFCSVILTLQQQLPLEHTPKLLEHWRYLFGHSIGCVGHLKMWLNRALKEALSGQGEITLEILQKTALPDHEVNGYVTTTLAAEEKYAVQPDFLMTNQLRLGLPPVEELPTSSDPPPKTETTLPPASRGNKANTSSNGEPPTKTGGRSRKVGQRNPTYDPTGDGQKKAMETI